MMSNPPVALVTGGTSGIGRASALHPPSIRPPSALHFAKAGYRVVVAGRRPAEGDAVVAEITAAGGTAKFIRTDVTVEAQIAALIDGTLAAYGPLDAAFNNAGVELVEPLLNATAESFQRVMIPNVLGVLLAMKHQIPAMLKTAAARSSTIPRSPGKSAFPARRSIQPANMR